MNIRVAFLIVALGLGGCAATPLHMRMAPDLAGTDAIPVEGRQAYAWSNAVKFGMWQATTTSSPDTFFRSTGIASANQEMSEDRNRVAYELQLSSGEGKSLRVDCQAFGRFAKLTRFGARVTDETEITLPGYPRMDCEFGDAASGLLEVRAEFPSQRDQGTAKFGQSVWQIRSVNQTATQRGNLPLARFGYEGLRDGRVVAAVETTGTGRVWMLPGLPPQQQREWAAVASALLYYGTLLELQDQ